MGREPFIYSWLLCLPHGVIYTLTGCFNILVKLEKKADMGGEGTRVAREVVKLHTQKLHTHSRRAPRAVSCFSSWLFGAPSTKAVQQKLEIASIGLPSSAAKSSNLALFSTGKCPHAGSSLVHIFPFCKMKVKAEATSQ